MISQEDKDMILIKASLILILMKNNGIGKNEGTKIALKLLARLHETEGDMTDENIKAELDFLCINGD